MCQGTCRAGGLPFRLRTRLSPGASPSFSHTDLLWGGRQEVRFQAWLAPHPIYVCFVHFWLHHEPWDSLVSGLSSAVAPSAHAADPESSVLGTSGPWKSGQMSSGLVLR